MPACKLFRSFSKENDCLTEPSGRDRRLLLPRAAITPAHTMKPVGEGYLYKDERITPLSNSCPSSQDTPWSKSENLNLSLKESHKVTFLILSLYAHSHCIRDKKIRAQSLQHSSLPHTPAPEQHSARSLTLYQGTKVTSCFIHLPRAAHSEKGPL